MNDLISRQAAIVAVHKEFDNCLVWDESGMTTANEVERILDSVPSAQPEIIRCKDCKWWEKMQNLETRGYCHAAKHAHFSRNWEISIYRTTGREFYCAEAERRTE